MKTTFVTAILVLGLLGSADCLARAKVGQPAIDFQLKTYRGKTIKLSDYKGKTIVLAFWWSNTKTPGQFLALIERMHKTYSAKGVVFIALNYDRSRGWGASIWRKAKPSYTVVHDRDNSVYDKWSIRTHGAAIIDANFTVTHIVRRAHHKLDGVLKSLIK